MAPPPRTIRALIRKDSEREGSVAARDIRRGVGVTIALAAGLVTSVAAFAAHTQFFAPFTSGSDIYTSFTSDSGNAGPLGLLDDGTHFFVADNANGTLYRFASGMTGNAGSPQASAHDGLGMGLAFTNGGYYGLSRGGPVPAGLYRFNPTTLALTTSTPLVSIPGTLDDLTRDPVTGDLYASSTSGIYHISGLGGAHPTRSTFVTGDFDGMIFSPDGNVLYAASRGGSTAGHVVGFTRGGSPNGFDVNENGEGPDGITVAPPATKVNGVDVSNNVFVNENDGQVDRIDVNHGNAVTTVASGGTRGDFTTVGSDGCLYVTQTTTVEKLRPCFFEPTVNIPETPLVVGLPVAALIGLLGWGASRRRRGSPTRR